MTTKERKIKPPNDPTQMVGGLPKISINANKLQINEFLKLNKKLLTPKIQRSSGGKQKSLDVLREELQAGGHFVGVKDETNTSSRGAKTSKANVEKQKKEEDYKKVLAANPEGFNVKNTSFILQGFQIDTPSPAQLFSSGYGGLPIKEKMPVSELREYLSTKMPSENFKGLSKKELRVIYDMEQAKDAEPDEPLTDLDKAEAFNKENPGERVDVEDGEEEYNDETFTKFYFLGRVYYEGRYNQVYDVGGLGDDPIGVWNEEDEDLDDLDQLPRLMGGEDEDEVRLGGKLYERFNLHPRFEDNRDYWLVGKGTKGTKATFDEVYDKPGGKLIGRYANNSDFVNSPIELFDISSADEPEIVEEETSGWGEYLSDEADSDDDGSIIEDTSRFDPLTFEGVDYLEEIDTEKVFNLKQEYVGEWNVDVDELIWTKEKYAREHEEMRAARNV